MSQLHPAVLELRARGRFAVDLEVHGWDETTRTSAGSLVLSTVRELLTNAAKHAQARRVDLELRRLDGYADLIVADDG